MEHTHNLAIPIVKFEFKLLHVQYWGKVWNNPYFIEFHFINMPLYKDFNCNKGLKYLVTSN